MNNRIALYFMGLFALIFVSACQTPAVTAEQNSTNNSLKSPENLAKECLAKGGTYTQQGRLQMYRCVMNFSDAGKSCSDSSECQGSCLSSDTDIAAGTSNLTGTCAATDSPFGCRQIIEGGVSKGTLCVD